ncbi:MAG: helix-turn-helix domain-containing protein [Flammeovirgaceae bacterium]
MLLILQTLSGFIVSLMRLRFEKTAIKGIFNSTYCSTMDTFGKKLRECREAKDISQAELARQLGAHHSIIGRYERDEVKPTIDVVKKMAKILDTTVGYLLGESSTNEVLRDPAMLKRLNDINSFSEEERKYILYALDALIKNAKLKSIS